MEGVSELESLLIELSVYLVGILRKIFLLSSASGFHPLNSVFHTEGKKGKTIKETDSQMDTKPLLLYHMRIYSCEYHRDRNRRQGRRAGFLPLTGSFRKMEHKKQGRMMS